MPRTTDAVAVDVLGVSVLGVVVERVVLVGHLHRAVRAGDRAELGGVESGTRLRGADEGWPGRGAPAVAVALGRRVGIVGIEHVAVRAHQGAALARLGYRNGDRATRWGARWRAARGGTRRRRRRRARTAAAGTGGKCERAGRTGDKHELLDHRRPFL